MGIIDSYFQKKKKKLGIYEQIAPKPTIIVPDNIFTKGFDALNDKLYFNLAPPVGKHSDIWTRPAPKFPGAYLWDSCFITQAWKIWDPRIGLRALKAFVEFQQEDGRMPHMVFWGGKQISKLSNPPFLAWAIYNLLQYYSNIEKNETKLEKWVNFYLDPLIKFTEFRKQKRLNKETELYFWEHSYESGIDNSPRFTSIDEKEENRAKYLAAIDLNAEIVLQYQSILKIIERFKPDHSKKGELEKELTRLKETIVSTLWHKNAKIFCDYNFGTKELEPIDTIASYFPLVMNDLNKNTEIYNQIIKNLKDPNKYYTKAPAPSVARDSPNFIKDMWRGPIWMNTAYLVVKGLEKQGEYELAGDFAYKLAKAVYYTWKNEGSFYEFYDPERYDLEELDRKKGNLWKKISLGPKPVKNFAGWSGDVNPLVIENVLGIRCINSEWILNPHLPKEWMGNTTNPIEVNLPYYNLNAQYVVKNHEIEVTLKINEETKKFSLKNHQILKL